MTTLHSIQERCLYMSDVITHLVCDEEHKEKHQIDCPQQAGFTSECDQQESTNHNQHPVRREELLQGSIELLPAGSSPNILRNGLVFCWMKENIAYVL